MRLPKLSLAGFRDPVRRPRYIIMTFAVFFALAMFVIVALGATSTRWFCEEACHKVQDDTIHAYQASAHSQISCMACHESVNASPITFLFAKMKSGLEVIPTVGNTFSLPLNKGSALALNSREMGSQQCTQCHSDKRKVTPESGLKIDHDAHANAGIWCTVCHNRTAHNEKEAPPTLSDPSGHKNTGHANFLTMDACFRCHDLKGTVKMTGAGAKAAPGACTTCHTSSMNLKPETHAGADWARKGHSEAALEARAAYAKGLVEQKELVKEGVPAYLAAPVNTCFTCHDEQTFCNTCHGVQMPHPSGFAKNHKAAAAKGVQVCVKCHQATGSQQANADGTPLFCSQCHHKDLGADPKQPWTAVHKDAVHANGAAACFPCHSPVYCAKCHVSQPAAF